MSEDLKVQIIRGSTMSTSQPGWGYAITRGEGAGSLIACEFHFETFDDAWAAARPELKRKLMQDACEHVFEGGIIGRTCRNCGYHDWKEHRQSQASV